MVTRRLRREAIADADQAGELANSWETKTPRVLRTSDGCREDAALHDPSAIQRLVPIFCVASRARSSPHKRVVVNKTSDTLPEFPADYMLTHSVPKHKRQPCITFVESCSGAVISFMCAMKEGYEDLTREFLRLFGSALRQRGGAENMCVREKRELGYDSSRKQVIRATVLSQQCTDTYKDSHDDTKHKSKRTRAHTFQQHLLPFHLRIP